MNRGGDSDNRFIVSGGTIGAGKAGDRPRAAIGRFPYPHRTVARVDRDTLGPVCRICETRRREPCTLIGCPLSGEQKSGLASVAPRNVNLNREPRMTTFGRER